MLYIVQAVQNWAVIILAESPDGVHWEIINVSLKLAKEI
jgi:hypothetical protein